MKNHSMLSEIWRRFKKNKQALVGLIEENIAHET